MCLSLIRNLLNQKFWRLRFLVCVACQGCLCNEGLFSWQTIIWCSFSASWDTIPEIPSKRFLSPRVFVWQLKEIKRGRRKWINIYSLGCAKHMASKNVKNCSQKKTKIIFVNQISCTKIKTAFDRAFVRGLKRRVTTSKSKRHFELDSPKGRFPAPIKNDFAQK